MRANELFAAMSPQLSTRILDEVHATDRDLYKVALQAVAQTKKVRPIFMERQSKADRHRMMAGALALKPLEIIAGNVLSGWLVKNQSALLCEFLDSLKIKHDKGVVENLPETVENADLDAAVNALLGKHEREIVALYLHAFFSMNEANWPHLDELLHTDERLALGR